MTYSLLIIKIDLCFNAAEFDISVENFFYIYSFKNFKVVLRIAVPLKQACLTLIKWQSLYCDFISLN